LAGPLGVACCAISGRARVVALSASARRQAQRRSTATANRGRHGDKYGPATTSRMGDY